MEPKLTFGDFSVGRPTIQEIKDSFARAPRAQGNVEESSEDELSESFKTKLAEIKAKKLKAPKILDENAIPDISIEDSTQSSSQEIESSFVEAKNIRRSTFCKDVEDFKMKVHDSSGTDTSGIFNDTTVMPMSSFSSLPSDSTLSSESNSSVLGQEIRASKTDDDSSWMFSDTTQGSFKESSFSQDDSVFF